MYTQIIISEDQLFAHNLLFRQAVFSIKTNKRFESLNLLRLNIVVKFICHGNLEGIVFVFSLA